MWADWVSCLFRVFSDEDDDVIDRGPTEEPELQNQVQKLDHKLEDLKTCNRLIASHGSALHVRSVHKRFGSVSMICGSQRCVLLLKSREPRHEPDDSRQATSDAL